MFEMRGSVLADDGVRLSYKRAAEGPHRQSATTVFTDERLAKDALAIADASGVQRLTAVGFIVSCRFIQTCRC